MLLKTMKKNTKLNALLATTVCSMLTMSCAKELPELPVTAYPAIKTLPDLPPISGFAAQENLPELPLQPLPVTKNSVIPVTASVSSSVSNRYENVDLSAIQGDPAPRYDNPELKIIADDLVAALGFIKGMSPNLITVKAPADNSRFDELVKNAFANKGYAINNTRALNAGKQLTTSFMVKDRSSNRREITGVIAINGILIKRTYSVNDKSIEASTSYMIKGVQTQLIKNTDQVQVI